MPANKDAFHRYILIDRCLTRKNKKYFSAGEIIQYISDNLDHEISERTLQADIREMRESNTLGYHAPIAFDRKNGGYYYTEEGYSIGRHVNLNDAELDSLEFAAGVLDSFRNVSLADTFRDAIDKIVTQLTLKKRLSRSEYDSIIITESPVSAQGADWLDVLVRSIKEKQVLMLEYRKFGQSVNTQYQFHPYLLKEYNGRWYVLGLSGKDSKLITLGLDRIKEISPIQSLYISQQIDLAAYFRDVIGITVHPEKKPQKIVLAFNPVIGNYIRTKPMHTSQQIIKDSDKEFRISLHLVPTIELKSAILSYGSGCRVIQPQSLVREIQEELKRTLTSYAL